MTLSTYSMLQSLICACKNCGKSELQPQADRTRQVAVLDFLDESSENTGRLPHIELSL